MRGARRQPGKDSTADRALQSVVNQVQTKMKSDLFLKEMHIPNSRAEAKCTIFVSANYASCSKLVVFLQPGKGVKPGIWSRSLALKSGTQGSMLPYFKTAIQSGFGIVVLNPNTNSAMVRGHKSRIVHSSSPEEHVTYMWEHMILPSEASQIHFVAYDLGGPLVKYLLKKIVTPAHQVRLGAVAFIESTHQVNTTSDPSWLVQYLAQRAINFECSSQSMFSTVSSSQNRLGCTSLSAGCTSSSSTNVAWTIHSVQASVFVFLRAIDAQGLQEAISALHATIPNKLVVTVNRARLTGQPYHNPYAVVQCVGQKKETVGNHKHTMDPEWNQTFSFPVNDGSASLLLTVKDQRFPLSTVLGQTRISMAQVAQNRAERKWYLLRREPEKDPLHVAGSGEIELTLEWVHDTFVARSDSFIRGHSEGSVRGGGGGVYPPGAPTSDSHSHSHSDAHRSSLTISHESLTHKSTDIGESHCYLCQASFVIHRRRHCRMCLRAVCHGCSDRLFLPGFSEAKRVCTACCNLQVMMHQQGHHHHHHQQHAAKQQPQEPHSHLRTGGEKDISSLGMAEAMRNVERMHAREIAKQEEPLKPLTIDDFELLRVIGRGAFGKVMLVRKKDGKRNGEIFAMKILKKAHIIKNDQVENTKAEQHILKEIDHPYVVRLRFAFQNEDKLYLVMDYYPGGSLFYHLRKTKRFSEDRVRLYMAQLLTAIMHLHSKQIAYRDLKLENILMDRFGHISLTDFGLSKEGQEIQGAVASSGAGGEEGMKTICGTAEYMAPELLRHQRYGKVVDWWSYGILLFEMFTGRTPFVDRNRRQMFKNIMQMEVEFPSYIPATGQSLVTALLNRDPAKRLGSGPTGGQEIMAHPFFADIDWQMLFRKEIKPTFVPDVEGETDVTNIPQMFQNMEAIDSPVAKGAKGDAHHFEDFSFQEESRLRKAEGM